MTEQENFWAGEFGTEYSKRCYEDEHSISKVAVWADILRAAPGVNSVMELGCNTGGNLKAIHTLFPEAWLAGCEINEWAADRALLEVPFVTVEVGSMFDLEWTQSDLVFTSGVLIHTPPEMLPAAYDKLYELSGRYIMVMEYYSPRPEEIPYRGYAGRLWKRDFAGEILDRYPLRLVDYRFIYHRDVFPQDDMTWFLMERTHD